LGNERVDGVSEKHPDDTQVHGVVSDFYEVHGVVSDFYEVHGDISGLSKGHVGNDKGNHEHAEINSSVGGDTTFRP
jgi:hypothetical protein